MAIRSARPEDASALSALCLEVWLHTYCRPGIPPVFADYALKHFSPEAMASLIEDRDSHLLVDAVPYEGQEALRGYLLWGCPHLLPLPQCPRAEIITLYVRDRHKRLGLGSALLEACYRALGSAGHEAAFLTPNAENAEALAFYRQKGFVPIGETHFELDGRRYLNLVLRKDVPKEPRREDQEEGAK